MRDWDSEGGSLSKNSPTSFFLYQSVSSSTEDCMQSGSGSYPWFALHVRSRHENSVAAILGGKGYECFLPLYRSRRLWSDRIKEIELPLFAGYVFCRFDMQRRLPILTTPGVVEVVGIAKRPIPIDDSEIAALQATLRSGLQSRPWPFLQVGQKVRVEAGPLCGVEGILLGFKGRQRLVLSVTLLQRSVAVEVDGAWIAPIPQKGPVSTDLVTYQQP